MKVSDFCDSTFATIRDAKTMRTVSIAAGTLDVKVLFDYEDPEESHWGTHERLVVFEMPGGFGFYSHIPAGYGTYTYDPDDILEVMYTDDYERFLDLCLTRDQRELVRAGGVK